MMADIPSKPSVLILASRFDFTCDYVVAALRRRGTQYLRLNSEDLPICAVALDPISRRLHVQLNDTNFLLAPDSLRSVLFRRPVFLRDYGDDNHTAQECFGQIQWAAFMRNLVLFHEARWYNDPAHTYRAEHKALQLYEASRIGLRVPATVVTNSPQFQTMPSRDDRIAVKGLDTVLVREGGDEIFGFTTFANFDELNPAAWASAPGILQQPIENKTDIRVTVVEDQVYTAEILVHGKGIRDDWRTHKGDAQFAPHDLNPQVTQQCIELVKVLGLRFGAIDLALSEGAYYFLEINPTGEWAWLVDAAGLSIDEGMADALAR